MLSFLVMAPVMMLGQMLVPPRRGWSDRLAFAFAYGVAMAGILQLIWVSLVALARTAEADEVSDGRLIARVPGAADIVLPIGSLRGLTWADDGSPLRYYAEHPAPRLLVTVEEPDRIRAVEFPGLKLCGAARRAAALG